MKKKKYLFLFALVFAFSCILFACDAITLSSGPSATDTVYGNGGSAVVKGDYLYFANAFIDYNDLGINDNKYDKNSAQNIYGIYRTKLNSDGKVITNSDGVPQGAELLVYNVGGYAYSGLYACGDYLYYTTPFSKSANSGTTTKGLVRFERVKLNGNEHKILHETDAYSADCSYNIVYSQGTTYITLLNSDSSLMVIKCTSGNVTKSSIASNITSYAVYSQKDIKNNESLSATNSYVYYTTKDSLDNYKLHRCVLGSTQSETLFVSTTEVSLIEVKNERVYYTQNSQICSSNKDGLDVVTYSTRSISTDSTSNTIVDYVILDSSVGAGLDRGILGEFYDGTNYSLYIYNGTTSPLQLTISGVDTTKALTLVATQNNQLYYQVADDTNLYKCSFELLYINSEFVLSNSTLTASSIATSFSSTVNETIMLDFDAERFFVYESVNSSAISYLKMYMINEPSYTDDENLIGQYIGVLA